MHRLGGFHRQATFRSVRIIAAAESADVDAIHPGYGFLAENAIFADQCRDCGIEFVGPSPEAMRLLGDKAAAGNSPREGQVPTVPAATAAGDRGRGPQGGGRGRLPGADQGGGRRRRAGHARRPERDHAAQRLSPGAARPKTPSRTPASTSRNTWIARVTSRSRSSATSTATTYTCSSASARSSVATRSSSRKAPRRSSRANSARTCVLGDRACAAGRVSPRPALSSFCWIAAGTSTSSRPTPASRWSTR